MQIYCEVDGGKLINCLVKLPYTLKHSQVCCDKTEVTVMIILNKKNKFGV